LFNPDRITAAMEAEVVCQLGALQNARIRQHEAIESFSRLASSLGVCSCVVNAQDAKQLAEAVKSIGQVPQGQLRTRQALVTWNAKYNAHSENAFALMNRIASKL